MELYTSKFIKFHSSQKCKTCGREVYKTDPLPPFKTIDDVSFEFLKRDSITCCGKELTLCHLAFYNS